METICWHSMWHRQHIFLVLLYFSCAVVLFSFEINEIAKTVVWMITLLMEVSGRIFWLINYCCNDTKVLLDYLYRKEAEMSMNQIGINLSKGKYLLIENWRELGVMGIEWKGFMKHLLKVWDNFIFLG